MYSASAWATRSVPKNDSRSTLTPPQAGAEPAPSKARCEHHSPRAANDVRIEPSKALVLLLLAVASVLIVSHFSGHYGWPTLMRNTFTDAIATPGETVVTISFSDYLEAAKELGQMTAAGSTVPFLLLGVLALASGRARRKEKELIWIVFAALAARLALFPHLE